MTFKIGNIYIENFKSIEKAHLNFFEKDLIVLDGPNGFGKTTIFDAVELVLTGGIRRIENVKITDGKRGYDDFLFAKNQSIPIILKVELYDNAKMNRIFIGRKIAHSHLTRSKKKPQDFPATLHLLSTFNDDLTEENLVDNIQELNNVKDTYSLYNYVEQEDSTHFFKKNENDRMMAISKLFNIEKEVTEIEKLTKIRNVINSQKNKIKPLIKNLEKEFTFDMVSSEEKKIDYIRILPEKLNKLESWDNQEITPLDLSQKEVYFKRIANFKYLVEHLDLFKTVYKNEKISSIMDDNNKIETVLYMYNFQEKMPELKNEALLQQKLKTMQDMIATRDITNPNIEWELLFDKFKIPMTMDALMTKLHLIKSLKQNSNIISQMLSDMVTTRNQLLLQFTKLSKEESIPNEECPLCGADWKESEILLEQISKRTLLYTKEQNNASIEKLKLIDELYTNIFDNLVNQIDDFRKTIISSESFEALNFYYNKRINIIRAKSFFKEFEIDIEEDVFSELENFGDARIRINNVQDKLKKKIVEVLNFEYENYETLKDIYLNIFERNDEVIENIDVTLFESKKNYINYIYSVQSSLKYKKYLNLTVQFKNLENHLKSINTVIKIYKESIEKHRNKMIKEIEIPFYIFSGKIIQNYQRGVGIFIREEAVVKKDGEIKSVRFVPPQKTDHDIIHTFSSGQLSATVLAFTLALKKVYGDNKLNSIFIDDPIQKMDEMNMASFVELLRTDFGEQQIILSTHESQISLYLRYKFSKYGFSTMQLNVKDKL